MQLQDEVMSIFPEHLRFKWRPTAQMGDRLQEIRLRARRPVMLYMQGEEWYTEDSGKLTQDFCKARILSKEELEQIIRHICRYSLYAYEEEMSKGYVSADGGFRVGIAGEVILNRDGSVKNVRYISSLNIRIAHEAKDAGRPVLPYLYEKEELQNTLILSPPGCGKTTLLRDIVRLVSDGNEWARGQTVGIVDERSELAGSFHGMPRNDVGKRTDVLDGCPKSEGMMMLLRSMSPRVMAVDELGGSADVQALEQVIKCGCGVLATMHGSSYEEACQKPFLAPLIAGRVFSRYVVLGKRQETFVVEEIRDQDGALLARKL